MFYPLKLYLRDLWITAPLAGTVVIQLFCWWYLAANINPGAGQIFLHYNILFGVDLVGEWWRIFAIPGAGILIILLNYAFSFFSYSFDKFLARLLSSWVLFMHAFLMTAVVLLVRLNS